MVEFDGGTPVIPGKCKKAPYNDQIRQLKLSQFANTAPEVAGEVEGCQKPWLHDKGADSLQTPDQPSPIGVYNHISNL